MSDLGQKQPPTQASALWRQDPACQLQAVQRRKQRLLAGLRRTPPKGFPQD